MNKNKIIFDSILYSLLGISVLLSALFAIDVISEGLFIMWCYILLGVATATAIIFPIITMVGNPKKAKSAVIGIAALVIICGISYSLGGNEEVMDTNAKLLADSTTSQVSEGGLIATYVLLAGAIGVIIFSEVSKIFK